MEEQRLPYVNCINKTEVPTVTMGEGQYIGDLKNGDSVFIRYFITNIILSVMLITNMII